MSRAPRPCIQLVALAGIASLAYALGVTLAPRARALDPDAPEEARAIDRVLPHAVARVVPSLLRVHPRGEGPEVARKTRSAVALAPDVAVMDAVSITATGVDDLVLEDSAGKVHPARIRGRDLRLRIIVLEAPDKGLVPAVRSGRVVEPGTFVVAVGSVYESANKPSASFGIVSACGRFDGRAVQVDCGIDPSNAGGALVDLDGALVGVPVLVDRKLGDDSGVGFAVPFSRIEPALPRLRAGEELEPGFLGIALPKDDPTVAPSLEGGIKVEGVIPGGAAKAAGIRTDDVIIRVDGHRIRGVRGFIAALSDRAAGDKVELVILRAGAEITLEAKLGARK